MISTIIVLLLALILLWQVIVAQRAMLSKRVFDALALLMVIAALAVFLTALGVFQALQRYIH